MADTPDRVIVVTGATGHQGGAVARHLLRDGWRVRALTRDPSSTKARALARLGAEIVQGDMADPATLRPVFAGAYGVFSVQNPMISGFEAEIRQGKTVANVASETGVQHVVYGSTGTGAPGTGIGSWESKLQIEAHMRDLGLPVTVLRPKALMELMTDKVFYPPVAVWSVMPKLMGADRPMGWTAAEDVGAIAASVLAEPEQFIGQDLSLASDLQSIEQCRALYREVMGRFPRRVPMPTWLFERFTGSDLTTMWRWLNANEIDLDTSPTRKIHPEAMTVETWLRKQKDTRSTDQAAP